MMYYEKMDIVVKDMVCRLCLKTPLTEFTVIGETAKEILDVLLVKMDFDTSTKPLMCKNCTEIVKRSLSFKSVCVDTEEILVNTVSFHTDGDRATMCRFCMKTVREGHFVPLDVLLKRGTFSKMIKEYMFHMDLNIVKNPLICHNCRDNMENYFKFLQNCRDTEEKINAYQRNDGVNKQNIMLVNVSETYSKYTKKELHNSLMEIKEESDRDIEGIINRGLPYRNEKLNDYEPCTCDAKDSSHCFKCHATLKEALATEDIKVETVALEVNNLELKIETEELIIKDEIALNESTSPQKQPAGISKLQLFGCDKCEFKSKYNNVIKRHYLLIHSSSIRMYRCDACGYQTKLKSNLKNHILVHQDSSDIKMHQCDKCEYQTKRKTSLKTHMLVHKDSSEVQMYNCDSCNYQTNRKNNLGIHMLVHQNSSEVQMYQCDKCKYQTKHKGLLKRHTVAHKDSSEVQMYKCDNCEYETRHKRSLGTHMLVHKNSSEVQMYQCDSCDFSSKYKGNLKDHLLTHRDYYEYQCEACDFKTNGRRNLTKHMLVHKDSSEVQMYRCDSCGYQTRHKKSLKRHTLVHKDPSEIQMHKCGSCEYQTKRKDYLKKHMLVHSAKRFL